MKAKRIGLAAGLALAAVVAATTWPDVWAHIANTPAYTSYASGDFFFPPYPSDSDRMGVGGSIAWYDLALRAGWYTDWDASANPPHPGGVEYARLIRFTVNTNACGIDKMPASQRSQVVASISGTALIDNLRANPGALWLIGNEPDSIYNCSPIMPELYAQLYHEFYTLIKVTDPSARVAIGAIVQPSPLRLEYLDKVLSHYQALYGERLPTALWNIHLYAFQERAGLAGAGVPPDASSSVGWTYNWAQSVDIDILAQNLRAMRQWMSDRGERDKPLIVTEFGQLVPDDGSYTLDGLTFTEEVSRDYLQGSLTHFLTAADPLIGYPADANRLVQMWAWYSLYDPNYGGDLLYSDGSFTPAGTAFVQTAAARFTPAVDLYPIPLITPTISDGNSGPVGVSLTVQIDNHGSAAVDSAPVRFEQFGQCELIAHHEVTVSRVLTRYGGIQPQASVQWIVTPGLVYTLTAEIDPARTLDQARRTAQRLAYSVGEASAPDLAVASLAADRPPAFLWAGPTTTTYTATLRNTGNLTSAMSVVRLSSLGPAGAPSQPDRDVPVPPLAPSASVGVTSTLPISPPGRYVIRATLTRNEGLDQCLANNTAEMSILAARVGVYLPIVLR